MGCNVLQLGAAAHSNKIRILLGEFLYILQLLFWAYCKHKYAQGQGLVKTNELWKLWLISLGFDVASLLCLHNNHQGNEASTEEWKHWRLHLLLYVLCTPCHDHFVMPVSQKVLDSLVNVPLFGNLVAASFQDWLYYWRVYQLEEYRKAHLHQHSSYLRGFQVLSRYHIFIY